MVRWSVDIIGKRLQHVGMVVADNEGKALEEAIKQELGTVETQTHHEAYVAAIKKFRVPIEQQNRLFVWIWPRRDGS
jgi:hypothetical protein